MKPLTITDAATLVLGLQDELRRSEESRDEHRLHGVLLVAQGMTGPEVGQLFGDAPRSVEYWVRHFEDRGWAGLVEGARPGRPQRRREAPRQEAKAVLRRTPAAVGLTGTRWDGKTLSVWIERRCAVRWGVRHGQRRFRPCGFRLRQPRPLLAHADPERQKTHKKLQVLSTDPAVDLWALDEVHFQPYGSRCRMGVPPETKDPVLLHYPTRRSVGYFGAVRWRDGKFFFRRETGKFNALTCGQFLKHLRAASSRTGRRVVVIADKAKYHQARLPREGRQQHAEPCALDFLPAYSPELNPIERAWKLTRRGCLHNRYFAHWDEVILAVETEFAKWIKPNNTLRRLCAVI